MSTDPLPAPIVFRNSIISALGSALVAGIIRDLHSSTVTRVDLGRNASVTIDAIPLDLEGDIDAITLETILQTLE